MNRSSRTLYVGILDLPESFGIFTLLHRTDCLPVATGEAVVVNDGIPIQLTVPDELWEAGVTELKNLVLFLVTSRRFDAQRLEQLDLQHLEASLELRGSPAGPKDRKQGALERLLESAPTARTRSEPPLRIEDWRTLRFTFTTIRPRPPRS